MYICLFFLHLLGTCLKNDDTLLLWVYNENKILYFSQKFPSCDNKIKDTLEIDLAYDNKI